MTASDQIAILLMGTIALVIGAMLVGLSAVLGGVKRDVTKLDVYAEILCYIQTIDERNSH